MIKKKNSLLNTYFFTGLLLLTFLGTIKTSLAQENLSGKEFELTAFEIMEKVSAQMKYPEGLNKIQLTLTDQAARTVVYKGTLYQKKDDSLFMFDSMRAGRVLKLLFNNSGLDIYAYLVHERRFFHKRAGDRFESVLDSGFYYADLSNSPFLENFTPRINGTENKNGKNLLRVENIPLDRGKYSRLNVLVDPGDEYKVRRIDFFDTSGVLLKSLEVTFADMPVKTEEAKNTAVNHAVKWDMIDMSRGTIATLEFLLADQTARLDKSLFQRENIEK